MELLFALSRHTGVRLAEIGFLLILIAGVWFAAVDTLNPERGRGLRTAVAGALLAVGGLLLIIATHWGHFGAA